MSDAVVADSDDGTCYALRRARAAAYRARQFAAPGSVYASPIVAPASS